MEGNENNSVVKENEKDWKRAAAMVGENENIALIKLQFTDIFGRLKTVEMTREQFIQYSPCRYAVNRYAAEGMAENEMSREIKYASDQALFLIPDPETFKILPWEIAQLDVARFICRVTKQDGTPSWTDSRNILKEVIQKADNLGVSLGFRFQCDFYLFHVDDEGRPTTITHEVAGYYDAGSIDLAGSVRRDIMLCLEEGGMGVESAHHGLTPGHQSFVLPVREGIQAADYLLTLKAGVKRIAKSHGLHAAFMPKPVTEGDGSGLHVGILLERKDKNRIQGQGPDSKEEFEEQFKRGILKHMREIMAFTNPTVNSYKRLMVSRARGFQPEFPAASLEKEDIGVRSGRLGDSVFWLNVLYPDSSSNPYLLLAALAAAGLDGILNPVTREEYEERLEFPESLGEAVREMEKSQFVSENFTSLLRNRYLAGKRHEWECFLKQVTDWELGKYLYRC